ncbi:unnamed protein product (macronuclear) [Paramecium tetraurelia]|uniref:Uncharacterized protein n=1 Tax=Paramecium tetraurelia TaxID=5888 RepID=A0DXM6_PARTE|nr:uncharacterized protein GSPATT00021417001 [Paramecium tetraurelia]CAK87793.1 unnamed protein product [Paramecium tetraurelia]|eukprot:XP_001455190.1 hypothetical protein (macronuclear) [Paramecium tetraurelia strain d4-2]
MRTAIRKRTSTTTTTRLQIKKSLNIDVFLKQIYLRAEYFTQRYMLCFPNQKNHAPLIKSIYRVLLIPDNCIQGLRLSDKTLLYLIVHLKFAEKGIHPLQEQAYEKLQIILQFQ